MLNKQLFKLTLLLLIFIELLSLTSFIFPALNTAAFFIIFGLALIIAIYKLEWALYIILAELFIGSFGRLFFFEINGTLINLRIGLFLIVMSVWAAHELIRIRTPKQNKFGTRQALNSTKSVSGLLCQHWRSFVSTKFGRWYLALGIVLVWGLVWGLIRNNFANIFFDFNNWLYFLLVLPFYSVFVRCVTLECSNGVSDKPRDSIIPTASGLQNNKVKNILTILAASVIVLSIKTILLEWIFAHQVFGLIEPLYHWVRNFGIGEITFFANNFYRVFIQGQIWLLLGFFIFLGLLFKKNVTLSSSKGDSTVRPAYSAFAQRMRARQAHHDKKIIFTILILSSTALIISFSRSLWLGLIAGLAASFLILLFKFKWPLKKILKLKFSILGILTLELLSIFAIINIPPVKDAGDFGSLISSRLTQVEEAESSRINQLKPLVKKIIKHPIIGSGFGTTVSYKSADPRVVASTASGSGKYTTFALEWGYLDMLLKFGLAGLVIYLGLLWQLIKLTTYQNQGLHFGFLLALLALLVTNITTPYLNHPLGIGFIILMTVIVGNNKKSLGSCLKNLFSGEKLEIRD